MPEPNVTHEQLSTSGRRRRRLLVGAAIGCAVVIPLCCGLWAVVGGLVAYLFAGIPFVTEDPERVREVTRQIATIDIPAELQPTVGGACQGRWSARPLMAWTIYTHRSSNSYVALFTDRQTSSVFRTKRHQSRSLIDRYLHEHGYPFFFSGSTKPGQTEQYLTAVATVHGKQVALHFWKLTDTATGKTRWYLFENVPGETPDEPIAVKLFVDADQLDAQEIVDMIESIR